MVVEDRSHGFFLVEVDDVPEPVLAYVAGRMRRNGRPIVWVQPGDRVRLELSPFEPSKGRIVWRLTERERLPKVGRGRR